MSRAIVLAVALLGVGACERPTISGSGISASAADTQAPGLSGNYGYFTDYTCMDEATARARVDNLVDAFGVTDVQFYDWFVDYQTPTAGSQWTDPWFHQRTICLQTIEWYVDELHQQGARAWAYVQSIASEDATLANADAGIYPLIDSTGQQAQIGPSPDVQHPLYFANAGWATHQVGVWGQAVADLGFDGIHWDTLGPIAGDSAAETAGFHDFLNTASPLLQSLGLLQTLNFVNVSWWDESLLSVVAFPYAEVWSMAIEQQLYTQMASPAMQARWGVMPFYPSVDTPDGWTQSQTMIARWNEAPQHHLHYLVVGDGQMRLVNEYFPSGVPLTSDEVAALK
jgi:Glycosyl hydrolase family 66